MKKKTSRKNKVIARSAVFSLVIVCLVCVLIGAGKSSIKTSASETTEVYYTSIEIEKGDTLSGLAEEYGCTEEEIKEINGLESNTLYAGENLIVAYRK